MALNQRFIVPGGAGTETGASLDNAAPLEDLANQIEAVAAAGENPEVLIIAGEGEYHYPMPNPGGLNGYEPSSANEAPALTISPNVSSAIAPIVIRGVSRYLSPMMPVFSSDRVYPYTSENWAHRAYIGRPIFSFRFSNFVLRDVAFKNVGSGAVLIENGQSDFWFDNINMQNVRRGLYVTGGAQNAKFTRIVGKGTSKHFLRLRGSCKDILIDGFDLDGDFQSGDDFAMLMQIEGDLTNLNPLSSDLTIKNGRVANAKYGPLEPNYPAGYWNADGITIEGAWEKVLIENVVAHNCTDGGFDLKPSGLHMRNCRAYLNGRNARIWKADAIIENCKFDAPLKQGGTGGSHIIWMGNQNPYNGNPAVGCRVIGGVFDNGDRDREPFTNDDLTETGIKSSFEGAVIRRKSPQIRIMESGENSDSETAIFDARTKFVFTGDNVNDKKVLDFIDSKAIRIFSMRLMTANYSGPLIQVRRESDQAVQDIYATDAGDLDVAAIASFCGTSVGKVLYMYDQTGSTRSAYVPSYGTPYEIYNGTSVHVAGVNSRPMPLITAENNGYMSSNLPLTGNAISAAAAVTLGTEQNPGGATGGRYMSLGTSGSSGDWTSAGLAILLSRINETTATPAFEAVRLNSGTGELFRLASPTMSFTNIYSASMVFDGSTAEMRVNNANLSAGTYAPPSGANFSGTVMNIGRIDGSRCRSPIGAQVGDLVLFQGALLSSERFEIHNNQALYYGI